MRDRLRRAVRSFLMPPPPSNVWIALAIALLTIPLLICFAAWIVLTIQGDSYEATRMWLLSICFLGINEALLWLDRIMERNRRRRR